MAVDSKGNVYTTGQFSDSVDFDPGPGTYHLYAPNCTIFISKLDSSGNFVWAKSFPGAGGCGGIDGNFGEAIAVDTAGSVYTAGRFKGAMDFDPGIAGYVLTSSPSLLTDAFVSKLDSSGNFVWAKKLSGTSRDYASALVLDAAGNVYVAGTSLHDTSYNNPWVIKLDAAGNQVWGKSFGNNQSDDGHDESYAVAVDKSGNVFTTGTFADTVDVDPGPGTFYLYPDLPVNGVGHNIFISKLDSSGAFLWARSLDGITSSNYGYAVAVDKSGAVYSTGKFADTVDFDPGPGVFKMVHQPGISGHSAYISKLNASGDFGWAKQLLGNYAVGKSISLDSLGGVYVGGSFSGSTNLTDSNDFDPGVEKFFLTSNNVPGTHVFLSKLDTSGAFQWAARMGTSTGGPSQTYGGSICVDNALNVYTTGYFFGTADFDPGASVNNLTATGNNYNVFISKSRQLPIPFIHTPLKTQMGCAGSTATFSIRAINAGTYQWRKNGVNIPGATAASHITPPLTQADSGAVYDVVVALAGNTSNPPLASNPATLVVNKHRFIGSSNSAWTNALNWNYCGVPTAISHVEIMPGATPLISTAVSIWNLHHRGAYLNVSSTGTLNILGQ